MPRKEYNNKHITWAGSLAMFRMINLSANDYFAANVHEKLASPATQASCFAASHVTRCSADIGVRHRDGPRLRCWGKGPVGNIASTLA